MAKLEQLIHAELVHLCGGQQQKVKGVSQASMTKMRKGESSIKISTLKKVFEANGLKSEITITSNIGQTTTLKF